MEIRGHRCGSEEYASRNKGIGISLLSCLLGAITVLLPQQHSTDIPARMIKQKRQVCEERKVSFYQLTCC